jgi:hypothetical protein
MNIDEFNIYHAENPRIYEAFKKFTFQAINSGRRYFSARAVYERIRWFTMIEDNNEKFKMSDHPMPFYARLFEKEYPEYAGFFRKHKCEADKVLYENNFKESLFRK